MGLSVSDILSLCGTDPMKGSVHTRQKCPVCNSPFKVIPRAGLICPEHKTTPSRFYIKIYHKGKIRLATDKMGRPLKNYGDALSLLGKINQEIKERSFDRSHYVKSDQRKYLVENLLDKFWTAKSKEIAPGHFAGYRTYINRARKYFKGKDIRDLRKLDLIDYRDSLAVEGKTLKNHLDNFRAFLNWAKNDLEIISEVPSFPEVSVPESRFKWLPRDDQIKLFELIPDEDKPFFSFLMLHGCRPGEARALKVSDVDWKNKAIAISSTFSGTVYKARRKGRGAKALILPLHPESWDFIDERIRGSLPGAWLFPNPRNGEAYSFQAIRKLWDRVRRKAGVSKLLRLYDATRHSFASQLREAGVPLERIKDHLGHSTMAMTEKYAHGSLSELRASLEKISLRKVINGAHLGHIPENEEKKINKNGI